MILIMSKEYYKKKIIDLRADMAKEKEAKNETMNVMQLLSKGLLLHQARHLIVRER